MPMPTRWPTILITLALLLTLRAAMAVDDSLAMEVEQVLRDIRQDRPVPALDYLQRTAPLNADAAFYQGRYKRLVIQVETHPHGQRVASLLIQIPGPDQTRQILPAVVRVLGHPNLTDIERSHYAWDWPNNRSASLHYAKGNGADDGFSVVSLFYR